MRLLPILVMLSAIPALAMQSSDGSFEDLEAIADIEMQEWHALTSDAGIAFEYSVDLSDEDIREWASDPRVDRPYPVPLLSGWEQILRDRLEEQTVASVATDIASDYDLSVSDMELLIRRWIAADYHYYPMDGGSEPKLQIRNDLLAVVRRSGHAQLAVEAAADATDEIGELLHCNAEDLAPLLEGSPDRARDAWRIASAAPCTGTFLLYLSNAPERPVPALIRVADYGTLRPSGALAVYAWLTSEAGLSHIPSADRDRVAASLNRRYASLLLEVGLSERALNILDRLQPAERDTALFRTPERYAVSVDGIDLYITPSRNVRTIPLDLAITYFLAGRRAEAERLLQMIENLDAARSYFACVAGFAPRTEGPCDWDHRLPMDALALEHLLSHPDEDPYLLAETIYAADLPQTTTAPRAELRCRLFAESRYASICSDARQAADWMIGSDTFLDEHGEAMSAIESLALPQWADLQAAMRGDIETVRAVELEYATRGQRSDQPAINPDPPPFVQRPLPHQYQGASSERSAWPPDLAALPDGFSPVRWEAAGERVIAVSISQMLDPSGEVSGGGYWIHQSDDGGQNWSVPLYTGLSEHFPFVVKSGSQLPMIDANRLLIEVEIAELDTSSITYPPVGLQVRRTEDNLFLEIPLAELQRDTNGNGLTDLVERHLLLDQSRGSSGTPYIVGSQSSASCPNEPDQLTRARLRILDFLFDLPNEAIIEPVGSNGDFSLAGNWRRATMGMGQPLFLRGDPSDFLCLRSDRLIIIYSEADIAELQQHTPDFRTIELPQMVFNRVGNRGYAIWSAGWRGGTLRMRLIDGDWQVEEISSWIT